MKRLSLLLLILVAAPAVLLAQSGAVEPREAADTNVEYSGSDGTILEGYLAMPNGSGPFPAVLMIHEWWGLNNDVAALADALSDAGFVVLAPDAFRGSVAQTPQDARRQIQETPREQIFADLDSALAFLVNHRDVDGDRVGSIGFCFGGTHSMYLGTRSDNLAAVATFDGGGPITAASRLGELGSHGPVLGVFGAEDGSIPVSEARAFESALQRRGADVTVTIYPGVGHAFVGSENYNKGGTPQRAWDQMVRFFTENL